MRELFSLGFRAVSPRYRCESCKSRWVQVLGAGVLAAAEVGSWYQGGSAARAVVNDARQRMSSIVGDTELVDCTHGRAPFDMATLKQLVDHVFNKVREVREGLRHVFTLWQNA